MREVCAHAAIGTHDNVVRYFSAWSEGDRMLVSLYTVRFTVHFTVFKRPFLDSVRVL